MELLKEVLNEVGDLANIKPYPYRYDSFLLSGEFLTDKKEEVTMNLDDLSVFRDKLKIPPVFNPEENDIFQVRYEVERTETQHRKASYGELAAILKTVMEFCKQAFKDAEASTQGKPIFLIASQSKESEGYAPDPQKDALYRSIVLKNLPSGYRTGTTNVNGKPVIIIQKK